jgi:hypothetical protein
MIKLKKCDSCDLLRVIWKSQARKKYCKDCWHKIQPAKPINKISSKLKSELSDYSKKRIDFLKRNPLCQASIVFDCTKQATEIHHKQGRGLNLLVEDTWLAVCRTCHQYIEINPNVAKEKGLSKNRLT